MNDLVQRENSGWPQANPISLKFLTLDGARLFNNVGQILQGDSRFIFKNILPISARNTTELRLLQMLESAVVDSVLHLPVLDKQSNLWAVGWDVDFKWGCILPARCGFEFFEMYNLLLCSIIDPNTGRYKSYHNNIVSVTT